MSIIMVSSSTCLFQCVAVLFESASPASESSLFIPSFSQLSTLYTLHYTVGPWGVNIDGSATQLSLRLHLLCSDSGTHRHIRVFGVAIVTRGMFVVAMVSLGMPPCCHGIMLPGLMDTFLSSSHHVLFCVPPACHLTHIATVLRD